MHVEAVEIVPGVVRDDDYERVDVRQQFRENERHEGVASEVQAIKDMQQRSEPPSEGRGEARVSGRSHGWSGRWESVDEEVEEEEGEGHEDEADEEVGSEHAVKEFPLRKERVPKEQKSRGEDRVILGDVVVELIPGIWSVRLLESLAPWS